MIEIQINNILGEYKYKTVCVIKNEIVVDRFRINKALATKEHILAHPLYSVRVGRWEEKKIQIKKKPQGKRIGWGSLYEGKKGKRIL